MVESPGPGRMPVRLERPVRLVSTNISPHTDLRPAAVRKDTVKRPKTCSNPDGA